MDQGDLKNQTSIKMKKIALITPMLQPYRITFYEKLAFANPEYEFRIFHGVSSKESGRPNYQGETKFQNTGKFGSLLTTKGCI